MAFAFWNQRSSKDSITNSSGSGFSQSQENIQQFPRDYEHVEATTQHSSAGHGGGKSGLFSRNPHHAVPTSNTYAPINTKSSEQDQTVRSIQPTGEVRQPMIPIVTGSPAIRGTGGTRPSGGGGAHLQTNSFSTSALPPLVLGRAIGSVEFPSQTSGPPSPRSDLPALSKGGYRGNSQKPESKLNRVYTAPLQIDSLQKNLLPSTESPSLDDYLTPQGETPSQRFPLTPTIEKHTPAEGSYEATNLDAHATVPRHQISTGQQTSRSTDAVEIPKSVNRRDDWALTGREDGNGDVFNASTARMDGERPVGVCNTRSPNNVGAATISGPYKDSPSSTFDQKQDSTKTEGVNTQSDLNPSSYSSQDTAGKPQSPPIVDSKDVPWATGMPDQDDGSNSPLSASFAAQNERTSHAEQDVYSETESVLSTKGPKKEKGLFRKFQQKRSGSQRRKSKVPDPLSWLKGAKAKEVEDEEISEKDIIIAVMGPTGSGKSSFISKATSMQGLVGHDLKSCTSKISSIKLSVPELVDADIVFVDTPGFDDTNKPDTEILQMISDWLNKTYQRKICLDGLLYFHRISDNRMAGTPLKNLRLFEKICGQFENVILTTTMWEEVEEEEGDQREKELMEIYWKSMIKRGSQVRRFFHSQPSAFEVLQPITDRANAKHALLLQTEMTTLKKELGDTQAGKTLFLQLQGLVDRHQTMLERIRKELKEPELTTEQLKELMAEYQKVSTDLRKATEEMQTIATVTVGDRLKRAVVTRNFFNFLNSLRNFVQFRRGNR